MKSLTKTGMNTASWTVIWASLLTLVLYLVPLFHPIAYPFMLLSTLVHEMGHGVAAMLLGGNFESFKMWSDGSGVASINGSFGNLSKALVSAAGLLGPAILGAIFFWGTTKEHRARFLLAGFAIVLILSIMLVVRNLFGILFVSVLSALCFYFSLGNGKKYCTAVLAFLAAELSLSVFSRSDYLFTDQAITSAGVMPSDVAQIAQNLYLPYWFWGIVCGLVSIAVLALGFRQSLKS